MVMMVMTLPMVILVTMMLIMTIMMTITMGMLRTVAKVGCQFEAGQEVSSSKCGRLRSR